MKTYARIVDGVVVELIETDGNIEEMFHPDFVWTDVSPVAGIAPNWVKTSNGYSPPAPPNAEIVKARMWVSIKSERDRRTAAGFKVGEKWFHSDTDSRIKHLGLKDKARDVIASGGQMSDKLVILGQTVKWKTMDGTFVDLSAQLAFDIVTAAGDLDARLFATAETHRAAMAASADPAAYDFSAGWPAAFAE